MTFPNQNKEVDVEDTISSKEEEIQTEIKTLKQYIFDRSSALAETESTLKAKNIIITQQNDEITELKNQIKKNEYKVRNFCFETFRKMDQAISNQMKLNQDPN